MKWQIIGVMVLGACGEAHEQKQRAPADQPEVPPVPQPLSIPACLAAGGALKIDVSVASEHGAIVDMVLGTEGRVALASEDDTVKYWNVQKDGAELGGIADNFNPGGMYGAEFAMLAPITSMAYAGDTLWVGREDGQVCRLAVDFFVPQFATTLTEAEGVLPLPVNKLLPLVDGRVVVGSQNQHGLLHVLSTDGTLLDLPTQVDELGDISHGTLADEILVMGAKDDYSGALEVIALSDGTRRIWADPPRFGYMRAAAVADASSLFVGGDNFVGKLDIGGTNEEIFSAWQADVGWSVEQLVFDSELNAVVVLLADGTLKALDAVDGSEIFSVPTSIRELSVFGGPGQWVAAVDEATLNVYSCVAP